MDERTNAELTRDVARLEQGQVSRSEYTVTVAHLQQRNAELFAALAEERRARATEVTELGAELAGERRAREAAVDAIKKQLAEADKGTGVNLRQLIYSGLIPGILLLLSFLVQFLQVKGGK